VADVAEEEVVVAVVAVVGLAVEVVVEVMIVERLGWHSGFAAKLPVLAQRPLARDVGSLLGVFSSFLHPTSIDHGNRLQNLPPATADPPKVSVKMWPPRPPSSAFRCLTYEIKRKKRKKR